MTSNSNQMTPRTSSTAPTQRMMRAFARRSVGVHTRNILRRMPLGLRDGDGGRDHRDQPVAARLGQEAPTDASSDRHPPEVDRKPEAPRKHPAGDGRDEPHGERPCVTLGEGAILPRTPALAHPSMMPPQPPPTRRAR